MTTKRQESHDEGLPTGKGLSSRYVPWLFFGVFLFWIILLAIGAVAEVFGVQSILDWWIFRI